MCHIVIAHIVMAYYFMIVSDIVEKLTSSELL